MRETTRLSPLPGEPEQGGTAGGFRWVTCFSVLLVVLLTVLGGLRAACKFALFPRFFPGMESTVERMRFEPLVFPADWASPQPFPRELIDSAVSLHGEINGSGLMQPLFSMNQFPEELLRDQEKILLPYRDRINREPADSRDELSSRILLMAAWRPMLKNYGRLVESPEFSTALLHEFDNLHNNFQLVVPHALRVSACLHGDLGEWEEGFECGLLLIKSARRHPAELLETHQIAFNLVSQGIACLSPMVDQCSSPLVMTRVLGELESMPDLYLSDTITTGYSPVMAIYRSAKRAGLAVDLPARVPEAWYVFEFMSFSRKYHAFLQETISPDDPRHFFLESNTYPLLRAPVRAGFISSRLGWGAIQLFLPEMVLGSVASELNPRLSCPADLAREYKGLKEKIRRRAHADFPSN